jgi:hypothetical protein
VAIELQHFLRSQVLLTKQQASRILNFFFPNDSLAVGQISDEDAAFAQALLVEAIDASNEMGYVQILFDKAFMKVPNDFSFIRDLAVAFVKRAARNWFRHATQQELADPKIYESVRRVIAVNFRSVWNIRLQTGELTW